jgi:phosphatidylglycerol:prolipoprotein diacylglycerol transferase
MSIHGGIVGTLAFTGWWSHRHQVSWLKILDTLALPLAIALIFGRLANFINGELVGIPTQSDWGVIFPHIDDQLRHPSQLYEMGKNMLISSFLFWGYKAKSWAERTGMLTFVFIVSYGLLRFLVEFWREPDGHIGPFSMGQVLSLSMVLFAILVARFHNTFRPLTKIK